LIFFQTGLHDSCEYGRLIQLVMSIGRAWVGRGGRWEARRYGVHEHSCSTAVGLITPNRGL